MPYFSRILPRGKQKMIIKTPATRFNQGLEAMAAGANVITEIRVHTPKTAMNRRTARITSAIEMKEHTTVKAPVI